MRWSEANRRIEAAVDNVRGLRVWGVRAENGRITAQPDAQDPEDVDEDLELPGDECAITLEHFIDQTLIKLQNGKCKYVARVECGRYARADADAVRNAREVASIIGEHTMMH